MAYLIDGRVSHVAKRTFALVLFFFLKYGTETNAMVTFLQSS